MVLAPGVGHAGDPANVLMAQFGPYVTHFHASELHNNTPWLIGLEWQSRNRMLLGASAFRNSFEQPSQYAYGGKKWFLDRSKDTVYLKLTAGVLHGYKAPFDDRIPYNHHGTAFVVLPALGYQYGDFNTQAVLLGTNGVLFTFGFNVGRWE